MDPPNPSLGQDTPTWGLEGMGKYTVRSGYALITENQSDNTAENERWKTIWNWQGTWTDISWQPDPDPWMTMNTDGSVDQHHNATAGGAIRDASGNCLQAFAMNYGSCSITRAEIRGIVDGLEIAWQAGFRHVAVQTDSKCALQILTNGTDTDHQHAAAILKFQELTKRDWTLKMNHIYREGNALADHLANSAHSMALGLHQIDSSNSAVAYWIAYDRVRSSQPRLVLRNM
ncbi:Putative ribonuclease H protein At1g65750 [Linum perenne]